MRNKLNDARRYHSGTISNGVEKPFEEEIISKGELMDKPNIKMGNALRMTTAKMYRISFGHAGSP